MGYTDKDRLSEIIKALPSVDTKCMELATDCHDCPMEPLCDLTGDPIADIINALSLFAGSILSDTKEGSTR